MQGGFRHFKALDVFFTIDESVSRAADEFR